MKNVVLPYHPRPLQRKLHNEMKRFNVIVAHRRFGKTCFSINHLIRAALTNPLKNPRYLFIAPFRSQAKEIAWQYLKEFTRPLNPKFNESELRCELPNGARIQLAGGENTDSLRGSYVDGAVIDEVSQVPPRTWAEIIRPSMSDRKDSFAIFIGTPQGEENFFHELHQHALTAPNWFTRTHRASETDIIDKEELADARRSMSEDQYLQEFECSWQQSQAGSIYQSELATAEEEGRVMTVPWERDSEVHVSFDLGVSDATALVFWQQIANEIRFIDAYSASGHGLDHFVKVMRNEKPYIYGRFYFPHDVKVRELSTGQSRVETLQQLGINPVVMKRTGPEERIHAARMSFDRMYFDRDKFGEALRSLRAYKYDFDWKRKIYSKKPRHDFASHYADAFGQACEAFKISRPNKIMQQRDRSWIV